MNQAEEYLQYHCKENQFLKDSDIAHLMQSFADEQLKKKMPSDEEIDNKAYKDVRLQEEGGFLKGAKWLKQQILKP